MLTNKDIIRLILFTGSEAPSQWVKKKYGQKVRTFMPITKFDNLVFLSLNQPRVGLEFTLGLERYGVYSVQVNSLIKELKANNEIGIESPDENGDVYIIKKELIDNVAQTLKKLDQKQLATLKEWLTKVKAFSKLSINDMIKYVYGSLTNNKYNVYVLRLFYGC